MEMQLVMMMIFIISLLTTLIPLVFHLIFMKTREISSNGFKSYPFLGSLPDFLRNRHRVYDYFTEVLRECPTKTAVLRVPGFVPSVITANPQVVEHMLRTNFEDFPRGELSRSLFHDFLGSGIFNSDGEEWKFQRRIASHEFNSKPFKNFALQSAEMELQTRLLPLLESAAKTGSVIDLQDVLERFAFDVICKVAFDYDPGCLGIEPTKGDFMSAFGDSSSLTLLRFSSPLPGLYKVKRLLNVGSERKLKESISITNDLAYKIIAKRSESWDGNKNADLLSRFMDNSESSGRSLAFLRDNVISFILAGRDTTSSSLTWFFWLLSQRPEVVEKILKELEDIRRRNSKSIDDVYTIDEIKEMHYLQAAISESMRLYPPVPIDTKSCKKDTILPDGTFVGRNWLISYLAYGMSRMEDIWGEDCSEYKPERWIERDGTCKQESSIKYPIFHAGPRICVGRDMAYSQMKLVSACVLQRFQFNALVEKNKCREYSFSLTLRMNGGLPVQVKERRRK